MIILMGDLNPSRRIENEFQNECLKRCLKQYISLDVATHVDGRRLDVVVSSSPSLLVQVHNGTHCREHGCVRDQCGRLHQILESKDLDRYPITVACLGVFKAGRCCFRVFVLFPCKWHFQVPWLERVTLFADVSGTFLMPNSPLQQAFFVAVAMTLRPFTSGLSLGCVIGLRTCLAPLKPNSQ